jgi:hypothetical protein
VRIGAYATAGRRGAEKMEDRHVIERQLAGNPNVHLIGARSSSVILWLWDVYS